MEKGRMFSILVISIGVLALLIQAVGYFAPAWMSYDIVINSNDEKIKIEVDMGLWATTGCVDTPELGEQCRSFTNDELKQAMGAGQSSGTAKVAGLNFLDDFTKVKIIATFGGLLSVIGFVCTCIHSKSGGTKTVGIIAAASWGLGAILIFAAVGLQGQQNTNMEHGIDILETMPELTNSFKMKTHFPWAILMSGIGAALNVVVAVFLTFKTCNMNDPNSATASWQRFGNQAI